ncbi:chordin-like protein 1 [Uloborus diversus]|uniref:chordin-like protein 1 n=1 Tax=Uloborus diversus TaxID=327109 RepID=UPI00240970A6|nr:chordin-like protein 1 [Uloborus diversus]
MTALTTLPASQGTNHSLTALPPNSAHVQQILLLLLVGILASLGAPPPTLNPSGSGRLHCSMAGQEYEINQTWYKHLKTPALTICVHCLCKPDGGMNCSNVTCSSSMCSGLKKNACCEVCQDSSFGMEEKSSKNSAEGGGGSKLPCLHHGKMFQDGEEFTSNATGLQTQKPNQCIHCVCQAGLVLCRLRTCEPVTCSNPDTKTCCPTCKDEPVNEQAKQANPVVTIMVSDGQSSSGDCTAAGITYSHGSSWHPVIGPFGPMDCVYCKCLNGKIECSRLNCPPVHKLPCSKPIQVPGHCCLQCTNDAHGSSVWAENNQPILHQPSISVTMEEQGNHQIQENPRTTPSHCLPPETNTLVYRSHASSSASAYYQYAFQSVGGDQSTRLLTWTVKEGHTGDFSEQYLSKEEFKTLMGTFKFKLQGATRTKFMDKFIRKAKRLPDQCGNRCSTKIQRLEQVLHLKEVVRRQQCQAQETSFH